MHLSHASASRRIDGRVARNEGGGCICITLSKLTRKGREIAEIVRGVELLAGYPAKNASNDANSFPPNYNVHDDRIFAQFRFEVRSSRPLYRLKSILPRVKGYKVFDRTRFQDERLLSVFLYQVRFVQTERKKLILKSARENKRSRFRKYVDLPTKKNGNIDS